jgi:hypothetical protein
VHLEKMKKDHDDLELQNQAGAKKIEVWSQKQQAHEGARSP